MPSVSTSPHPGAVPSARRVALLAHGAGSTPDFLHRALGAPLARLGYQVVSWRWPAGPFAGGAVEAELAALAERTRPALVGGVRAERHAAASWAARTGWAGTLLLVMPAWTGAPDAVAAQSAVAADEIERRGLDATLARIRTSAHPWVAAELDRAWPAHGAERLVAALRYAAEQPAPAADDLRRIRAAAAVVALNGDPLHPTAVARQWAGLVPRASLGVATLPGPGVDGGRPEPDLGAAALAALRRLGGAPDVSGSLRSPARAPADRGRDGIHLRARHP